MCTYIRPPTPPDTTKSARRPGWQDKNKHVRNYPANPSLVSISSIKSIQVSINLSFHRTIVHVPMSLLRSHFLFPCCELTFSAHLSRSNLAQPPTVCAQLVRKETHPRAKLQKKYSWAGQCVCAAFTLNHVSGLSTNEPCNAISRLKPCARTCFRDTA